MSQRDQSAARLASHVQRPRRGQPPHLDQAGILAAYDKGEKVGVIAMLFGCSDSYPSLLAARRRHKLRASEHMRRLMVRSHRRRAAEQTEAAQ
jgi:hypothetical protein